MTLASLAIFLLASCTPSSEGPSSDNLSSAPVTSEISEGSSFTSTSDPSSSSSEQEDEEIISNITMIKEIATTELGYSENSGYKVSNIVAGFDAQVLSLEDYISANGETPQYKAFVANDTGYINIHLSPASYKSLNKYEEKKQVYRFKGYIAIHNGEIALDTINSEQPTYLPNVTLTYDLHSFAADGESIMALHERTKKQPYNVKGVNGSPLIYKHTLKYLMKVENEIGLFTDGTNVVMAHGIATLNSNFSANEIYDIYAREGLHRFRPQLRVLDIEKNISAVPISLDLAANATSITATELYKHDYKSTDKPNDQRGNMDYANLYPQIYKYSGYVNYYTIGDKFTYVFNDTKYASSHGTYTTARDRKSLVLNNLDYEGLRADWFVTNELYEYTPGGEYSDVKLDIYFAVYEMNFQNYWQIQAFTPFI